MLKMNSLPLTLDMIAYLFVPHRDDDISSSVSDKTWHMNSQRMMMSYLMN